MALPKAADSLFLRLRREALEILSRPVPSLSSPHSPRGHPEIKIPKFIYGSAGKKDQTANLIYEAIKAGFRAIDTAPKPSYFNERRTGEGIRRAVEEGIVKRSDLFIQTKFTPPLDDDELEELQKMDSLPPEERDLYELPPRSEESIETQLRNSIDSSLLHLTVKDTEPYIDNFILNLPLRTDPATRAIWKVLETYVPSPIRTLGVGNIYYNELRQLHFLADIKPAIVQNPFYLDTEWDAQLRRFCREEGIIYQSFWTLTENRVLANTKLFLEVEKRFRSLGIEEPRAMAFYSLVLGLTGISILNGTKRVDRMKADLKALKDIDRLINGKLEREWNIWLEDFKKTLGEFL